MLIVDGIHHWFRPPFAASQSAQSLPKKLPVKLGWEWEHTESHSAWLFLITSAFHKNSQIRTIPVKVTSLVTKKTKNTSTNKRAVSSTPSTRLHTKMEDDICESACGKSAVWYSVNLLNTWNYSLCYRFVSSGSLGVTLRQ